MTVTIETQAGDCGQHQSLAMNQLVPANATNIVTNRFRPPAASLLVTAISPSLALLAVGDPSILTLIGN